MPRRRCWSLNYCHAVYSFPMSALIHVLCIHVVDELLLSVAGDVFFNALNVTGICSSGKNGKANSFLMKLYTLSHKL